MTGALFEFHDGLHLRDSVLWFDTRVPRQLCFISHANIVGSAGHQKILATQRTVELLRAMGAAHGRGRRVHEPQALVSPYGRPFALGQLNLELFPSGYILGSASLLVRKQEVTIVYAGAINPGKNPLAQRLEARSCDVLVLPCLFGQRRYVFPPFEQTAEALVRFVQKSLDERVTPVIFCAPLGEAQLVIHQLQQASIPCRVHRQIFAACRVYQEAGLPLKAVRQFPSLPGPDEALIWPLHLRASPALHRLPSLRSVLVSGRALDATTKQQMGCDAAFCLSCHADYPAHLEYVRACEPKEVVLITPTVGDEIREDLEALGIHVSVIGPPQQMTLF